MLTGLAIMVQGPSHDFAGAGVFVIVVIVLIVLIFIRVYGGGNRFGGRGSAHRSRRRTAHSESREPERGESHGHRTASRRRPNRP
jgi:hypothetical protein